MTVSVPFGLVSFVTIQMEGPKAGRKRCGACFPAQPFWRPHPPSGGGITMLLWNGGCCPKRSLSAACVVLCENTSQGALGFYTGPTIANSKVCADWRPLHPRGLEQATPLRNSSCIQVGWEAERLCVHIVGFNGVSSAHIAEGENSKINQVASP